MTVLEDEIGALLKRAPGEPPLTLDPDAVLGTPPHRRLWLPALAAAVVVAALAVSIAVLVRHGGATHAARPTPRPTTIAQVREAKARAQVEHDLAYAALPSGAVAGTKTVHTDEEAFVVYGTQIWTVPGTLGAVSAYVAASPPAGLVRQYAGSLTLYFTCADRSIQYDFAARGSKVRVTVRVKAFWTPVRPQWSYVTQDATQVVVEIRRVGRHNLGRSTVIRRRIVTGADESSFARLVNAMRIERPDAGLCPEVPGLFDQVTFQDGARQLTVKTGQTCSGQDVVTVRGEREAVYLHDEHLDALVRQVSR